MKTLLPLFCAVLFVGCAHSNKGHETLELAYSDDLLEQVQKEAYRVPASAMELEAEEGKSLRRVYFGVLYQQYLSLNDIAGEANEVKYCPQFHHDKISVEEKFEKSKIVKSVSNKNNFTKHYASIKTEVNTLCEEGRSDNYYKFDNLITYHVNRPQFHRSANSMKAVLKIPVFANYYYLKMISHPSEFLAQTQEEKEMFKLSKTFWFEKYVVLAQTYRNGMIKAEMVKR